MAIMAFSISSLAEAPDCCQGRCPYGPSGPTPRALSGFDFSAALRNRRRIGFADYIRRPPLGARPIAGRRGPRRNVGALPPGTEIADSAYGGLADRGAVVGQRAHREEDQ